MSEINFELASLLKKKQSSNYQGFNVHEEFKQIKVYVYKKSCKKFFITSGPGRNID